MDLRWAASTDIEARARIELAFETLTHLTRDGLALVSPDGIVRAWNDAAAAITGITENAAVAVPFHQLFENGDALAAMVNDPCAVRFTRSASNAVHATVAPLTCGWLISFGEERRLRRVEQLKSELLAAVSHELKTPIAAIKAYATTLRLNADRLGTRRDEYLRTIDEQADRLTRVVDDLLFAARVDVELLLERRERLSLDRLLDAAIDMLPSQAVGRHIERRVEHTDVYGDPELLRLLFSHVVENALKFSSNDSSVAISASQDDAHTRISVRDSGIGIDAENLPYIFDRFYRAEHDLTAIHGGNGLGLYLAASIAQAHGGRIEVESTLGAGSTFTITLPVRM